MTIQAINSVRNNYAGVNFESRRDKKTANVTQPVNTSSLKAVPLAVMLAMSPLTPTNAESIMRGEKDAKPVELVQNQQKFIPKVFKTREVDYGNGLVITYNYVDNNGDLSNFERLSIHDNVVVDFDEWNGVPIHSIHGGGYKV